MVCIKQNCSQFLILPWSKPFVVCDVYRHIGSDLPTSYEVVFSVKLPVAMNYKTVEASCASL